MNVTESVGNAGEPRPKNAMRPALAGGTPTEDDVIGPYYRAGAPYRAKVSPAGEPGDIVVIAGRVWNARTAQPAPGSRLDVWQANAAGRYDNDHPDRPPAADAFANRCRVYSDDRGYYELETIFPGPYKMDATTWRTPHIHFLVRALGLRTLVTQLFFAGAPYLDTDPFVKPSLIVGLCDTSNGSTKVRRGIFDIVLAADVDESAS